MIIYNPTMSIQDMMQFLFKFRGTNCSAVAKELGMSRQALYRMIKNETMKLDLFLKVLKVLKLSLNFQEVKESTDAPVVLKPVPGERIRQKIKGVVYDTDKMFCLGETGFVDHVNRILCWEPVANLYFIVRCFDDGEKPYLVLIDSEEIADLYMDYSKE